MADALTLPSELCGPEALLIVPKAGGKAGEFIAFGDPVRSIDAFGGAALRALIEYRARHLQRRFTLSMPSEASTAEFMHALLYHECPRHLILPDDGGSFSGEVPESILLQAQPIDSIEKACEKACEIAERGGALGPAATFAAKYLPELVANTLTHGRRCPGPPIACAIVTDGVLQLVLTDLSTHRPAHDLRSLGKAIEDASEHSGLRTLVEHGVELGLAVELGLISGEGRLTWTDGGVVSQTGAYVHGFSAAISIPV